MCSIFHSKLYRALKTAFSGAGHSPSSIGVFTYNPKEGACRICQTHALKSGSVWHNKCLMPSWGNNRICLQYRGTLRYAELVSDALHFNGEVQLKSSRVIQSNKQPSGFYLISILSQQVNIQQVSPGTCIHFLLKVCHPLSIRQSNSIDLLCTTTPHTKATPPYKHYIIIRSCAHAYINIILCTQLQSLGN